MGAAYAAFAENERGRLKPGLDADFVALSVDPVEGSAADLLRRLPVTLSAALKQARKRAGMTQAEAAEGIGIAPEVYGRMERGGVLPSFPTLLRMCLILGSGPHELMRFAEVEPRRGQVRTRRGQPQVLHNRSHPSCSLHDGIDTLPRVLHP